MSKAATDTKLQIEREIETIRQREAGAPAITINPDRRAGAPVIGLSRVPVATLLDYIASGATLDDFLRDFPTVERDKAVAALDVIKEALEEGLIGERIDY
jgi:uncharacterized protein (DUF433 family)